MGRVRREDASYTANFCEENVWQLCQRPELASRRRDAVFISNAHKACPLWMQRASPHPREPVMWDYHVILLVDDDGGWHVWDLDTRLPFPCALEQYLRGTFPYELVDAYQPRFRLVDAETFVATFASDRSHMRRDDGSWTSPPPPWPAIRTATETMNLMRFVDVGRAFVGDVLTLDELRARPRPR
ncbi:MAG: protein N-terminal glutamine amidohydrolase [Myxococcota bacterium]